MANDPAASAALEYRKRKAETIKGTIEHREFEVAGLEVRTLDDGTLRMAGYGSITEVEYPVGPYTEVIRRGAFKRTLSESPDTVLLYGHDGMPLARTKTGTLVMEEDAKGLHWTADLDGEDPDSRVLARKVERGLIDQCSFAFLVTDQDWSDDWTLRSIKSVSIHRGDISLVAMGANEATSVNNVRSAQVLTGAISMLEQRAGKTLSAATVDVLTRVLKLVADADVAVDEAQPLLAELMGVPNPDDPEPDADVESEADVSTRAIGDSGDLREAIRHAVRAPDADERRAGIMARAAELGVPGLFPENWAQDGSLKDGRAHDTDEQRETYNDLYQGLAAAVEDAFEDYWTWVCDFTETDVIFSAGGELWSAPYSVEAGGPITIGERTGVRPVTEYVPTGEIERAADLSETRTLPDYTTRAAQEYELLMLREARR